MMSISIYFVAMYTFNVDLANQTILRSHSGSNIKTDNKTFFFSVDDFLFTPTVQKKKKVKTLHVKFLETFSNSHTWHLIFAIALDMGRLKQIFFHGFVFSFVIKLAHFTMLKHSFLELHTEKKLITMGYSANCRRNRCINHSKIINFYE